MPDLDNDIVGGKEGGGTLNPVPSDPTTSADGFRYTRKQLIAMGATIKPLTREEYLLSGDKESIGSPLNVKEQVLASVVGGGEEPTGTITITENGTGIDVAQYATANVNVPAPASETAYGTITVQNNLSKSISVNSYNGDKKAGNNYAFGWTSVIIPAGQSAVVGVMLDQDDENEPNIYSAWSLNHVGINPTAITGLTVTATTSPNSYANAHIGLIHDSVFGLLIRGHASRDIASMQNAFTVTISAS